MLKILLQWYSKLSFFHNFCNQCHSTTSDIYTTATDFRTPIDLDPNKTADSNWNSSNRLVDMLLSQSIRSKKLRKTRFCLISNNEHQNEEIKELSQEVLSISSDKHKDLFFIQPSICFAIFIQVGVIRNTISMDPENRISQPFTEVLMCLHHQIVESMV